MYDLYGSLRTRAFRVVWLLEELGVPYRFVETAPRSDVARSLSTLGRVPILKDGEIVLTDSVAIMTYLADKHGDFLDPAGTLARAAQDAMTQYVVCDMDAVLWTSAKHSFVLPEENRVPWVKPTLAWEWSRAVEHLAGVLADRPYLNGDVMTVSDILAAHCAAWANLAKLSCENIVFDGYVARMQARPAFGRVMALAG